MEPEERSAFNFVKLWEDIPTNGYFGAMAASILGSIALYLAGKKSAAQFIGLWAPTILNLALFNKVLHPSGEAAQLMGASKQAGREVRETVHP